MEYFQIIFKQLLVFIVYVLIGVIAVWKKVIGEKDLKVISNIVIKITMPVMLFYNTLTGASREQFVYTIPILLLAAVMFFCLYLLGLGMAKGFQIDGDKAKVYRATTMFGNVGFMGIPIMVAMFPEKGMLYIALFTVVDQMLLWTLGTELTTPEKSVNKVHSRGERMKKMINPSTAAIILALIGIMLDWKLPSVMDTALEKTGNITSPLAMIYLGGLFCFTDIAGSVKQKEFYGAVLIKMLLFPICFYQLIGFLPGIRYEMRLAISVLSAMPSMSSVSMLAESQGSEGEYSAKEVFLTTLFSAITLPVVVFIVSVC